MTITTAAPRFILSSNPANLATALEGKASATVEAEYGDAVVSGSILTMAHHGPRQGQLAPCAYPNGCAPGIEVVGLSHVDLDTLGGCMAILGEKPQVPGFWELAEFVDLNGPHKLGQSGASPENLRRLNAFWAWSKEKRVFAPRDGSVADVTEKIQEGRMVLLRILAADSPELLAKGDAFAAAEVELNKMSFVEGADRVLVRVSPQFVSHLYADPEGKVCEVVVAYTTTTGAITISFADKPKGKTARQIVQELWGQLAGGHDSIAGSPRDRRMSLADLAAATSAARSAL